MEKRLVEIGKPTERVILEFNYDSEFDWDFYDQVTNFIMKQGYQVTTSIPEDEN